MLSTELTVTESYEVAKSVCSGIKWIITSFKRDGIIRKNEIKIIRDNLNATLSAKRMQNANQLFILSMDKIHEFIKRYDIDNMRTEEVNIFYSKLEKLNNYFDNIIEDYSKGLI